MTMTSLIIRTEDKNTVIKIYDIPTQMRNSTDNSTVVGSHSDTSITLHPNLPLPPHTLYLFGLALLFACAEEGTAVRLVRVIEHLTDAAAAAHQQLVDARVPHHTDHVLRSGGGQ